VRGFGVRLLFLGPAGVLVLLFFLLPVALTLLLSLTDLSTVTFSRPRFVGLANYLELLRDPFLPLILGNTLKYVALTLAFNVLMGLFLALSTSLLPERLGDAFRALWLLPRITASVVYVLDLRGLHLHR
jgi:inositol-phosphate transport system permease protein